MKVNKRVARKPVTETDYLKEMEARRRKIEGSLKRFSKKQKKRDLSQINFQAQHWWSVGADSSNLGQLGERAMTIDQEKAALIYEAMRRRPEVQQAWLEHRDGIGANGWQEFVGFVVSHLRQSWVELDEITQHTLIEEIGSPYFVPPFGYSTFPDKTAGTKRLAEASFQLLNVPHSDNPEELKHFVAQARKLKDAGFLIVAVDNKTKQSVRYAWTSIESQPRSVRVADVVQLATFHLPPELPPEEKAKLEEKRKAGTFSIQDASDAWSKYEQERHEKRLRERLASGETLQQINAEDEADQMESSNGSGWQSLVTHRTKFIGKRPARGMMIEEKLFNFVMICRELEALDAEAKESDFVQRLRLL